MSPSEIRFAADAMVQSLAKWLRLLGYDCVAGDQWFGRRLVERAVQEDRWVLSRNTKFDQYLPQDLLRGMNLYGIESENLPQQLQEIVQRFGLDTKTFLFTRCIECNALLEEASSAEITSQVPELVRTHQKNFWRCKQCGRVYWRGSHVERSIDRLRKWIRAAP